jgi:hypothetical protein
MKNRSTSHKLDGQVKGSDGLPTIQVARIELPASVETRLLLFYDAVAKSMPIGKTTPYLSYIRGLLLAIFHTYYRYNCSEQC